MDAREFEVALEKTLADGALSRAEEADLRKLVSELSPNDRKRAVLRSRVFAVAARKTPEGEPQSILDWVRKLMNILEVSAEGDEVSQEAYFSPGPACLNRIVGGIDGAKKTIDVCVFTVTDDRITESLVKAHRRGVKVRLLTDNDKSADLGSDIDRLRSSGVAIAIDTSPFHMHHKFSIIDRASLLNGSYNWTRGAANDNEENLVVTSDPRLLKAFTGEFDKLWSKYAC